MKRTLSQKTAISALMCAQAVTISLLESLIPTGSFMPPGAKLGFSNIVTMFCAETLGAKYAFCVTVFKALFAFLTRGVTAGIMSFAGGILSTALMCLLIKIKSVDIGYVGIAVSSAICHNATQLAVSVFISGTPEIMLYSPVLFAVSIITGVLTGVILKTIMPVLLKENKILTKGLEK